MLEELDSSITRKVVMEKVVDNNKYEVYRLNISFKDSGHYTNSYIIKEKKTSECILIDPAYNGEYISECIDKISGDLKYIYLTHCHGDHISALEEICRIYEKKDVKIHIHANDKEGIFDDDKNCKYILSEPNFSCLELDNICSVSEKEILTIGDVGFEVIHTPGHTNGCSMLYEKEYGILWTGDTLFSDCYGRTDLKSGSIDDMKQSLEKVFNKFDNNVMIYPGHGESSLLGDTKRKVSVIIAFN